jgi:hypothetical protein
VVDAITTLTTFAIYCKEIVEANGVKKLWKHYLSTKKSSYERDSLANREYQRLMIGFGNLVKGGYEEAIKDALMPDHHMPTARALLDTVIKLNRNRHPRTSEINDTEVPKPKTTRSKECSNPNCNSVEITKLLVSF